MAKKETLSVEKALAEGYKFCSPQYEEYSQTEIQKCLFDKPYVLVDKTTRPFQISDETLLDLLNDYLVNQEEVEDDDGSLCDLVSKIDFSAITNEINLKLSENKYYFPTDIILTR